MAKRKPVKIAVVYVISLVLGILLLKKLSEQGKTWKKLRILTEVTFQRINFRNRDSVTQVIAREEGLSLI